MPKLIGEPISQEVIRQLQRREEIYSGTDLTKGANRRIRTTEDLKYIAGNGTWIRMTSGVNTPGEDGKFTSEPAKNFVLSGGVLRWNSESQRFERENQVSFANSTTKAGRYTLTDSRGIVPEPGITSFDIKHKNRYGTVREAVIKFIVWSKEDLDLAERFYLRPGFTVILEWGNSLYVENSRGAVEEVKRTLNYGEFFNNIPSTSVRNSILENIENCDFNYDGFIGFVTNFQWSFKESGGYECSVTAVSKGSALDGLKLLNTKSADENSYDSPQDIDQTFTAIEAKQRRSLLDKFIIDLSLQTISSNGLPLKDLKGKTTVATRVAPVAGMFQTPRIALKKDDNSLIPLLKEELGDDFEKLYILGVDTKIGSNKLPIRWIPFKVFLALVNIAFINESLPNVESFPGFHIDTLGDKDNEGYRTHNEHFSFDPFTCILPKYPQTLGANAQVTLNNVATRAAEIKPGLRENNDIGIIFVTTGMLQEELDRLYANSDMNSVSVLDYVKNVLDRINYALGDITSLDIHFDEDLEKHLVVDRDYVNERLLSELDRIPVINLGGLGSVIKEVSVESKITSKFAAQIAISAQGDYISNNTNLPLIDWNRGLVDRFRINDDPTIEPPIVLVSPDRLAAQQEASLRAGFQSFRFGSPSSTVVEAGDKIKTEKYLRTVVAAYRSFNNQDSTLDKFLRWWNNTADYDLFRDLQAYAATFCKSTYYTQRKLANKPVQGLIPVDLSFKLNGISGLKIGQVFRTGTPDNPSTVTPQIYDNYGFIITNLAHRIDRSSGQWNTEITAITFKLQD